MLRVAALGAIAAAAHAAGFDLPAAEPKLLPPEQAFHFSARALDGSTLEARFDVADGYYLYRDKLHFVLEKSPGVKRYPAVTPSHGVITAALTLAAQGGYAVEDIEKVESDFRTFSLSRMEARDEEEAGFCAPYLIAACLVHGAFGPAQILPEAIGDPRVRKLSERVVQIPKTAGEGNVVTLHLRGGKTLSARARGEHAVEPDFIALKFKQCASAALNARAVDEIRDIVAHLHQHPSLDRLMALARGA